MKNVVLILALFLAFVALGLSHANGQSWTKDTRNPLLSGGGTGRWDSDVQVPWVIFNSDSARYEMWYSGSLPNGGIGFAVSSDGVTWQKDTNPVLSRSPGTWDSLLVCCPCILRENGLYKMWYSGSAINSGATGASASRIGYATSPDGRHWTKYAGNPVLTAGSSAWEAGAVAYCSVIKRAGEYVMFYTGCIANANLCLIGRATSADGIAWQRDTVHNPVLTKGVSGSWDGNLYLPRVLDLGGKYYMWYTAEAVPGDNFPRIGQATSSDSGKTWTKDAQNPVLTQGSAGSWDERWVELGSVLLVGNMLHMWYDGGAPPAYLAKVGHATAPYTGVAEEAREVPRGFMLAQNYPNPFNPSTTIGYTIAGTGHEALGTSRVKLSVYDLLGREVAVLVNEKKEPGEYTVTWNAGGEASGVYLYRLTAGGFVEARKMVLVR